MSSPPRSLSKKYSWSDYPMNFETSLEGFQKISRFIFLSCPLKSTEADLVYNDEADDEESYYCCILSFSSLTVADVYSIVVQVFFHYVSLLYII